MVALVAAGAGVSDAAPAGLGEVLTARATLNTTEASDELGLR